MFSYKGFEPLTAEQQADLSPDNQVVQRAAGKKLGREFDVTDNDSVLQLQKRLAANGLYKGKLDGIFGRKTEVGLRQLQMDMDKRQATDYAYNQNNPQKNPFEVMMQMSQQAGRDYEAPPPIAQNWRNNPKY